MPTFSVIIPAYNAADTLAEALLSVENQLFTDWEVVLINDGSTDNTTEVFAEIAADDERFKIINQENKGLGAARNIGAAHAAAKWLVFLDADDRWAANKLQILWQYINKYTDVQMLYHPIFELYQNGRLRLRKFVETPDLHAFINQQNSFVPSAVAIRADVFKAAGGFIEDKNQVEDLGLWFSLYQSGVKTKAIQQAMTVYRIGQGITADVASHLQKVEAATTFALQQRLLTKQQRDIFLQRKYYEAARQNHKLGLFAQASDYYNRNKTPSLKMQLLRVMCYFNIAI